MSSYRKTVSRRQSSGFSLLEVLVTLFVFSVGLLGLASLQAVSIQSNQSAFQRTQAVNMAYEMLDFWRANRTQVLDAGAAGIEQSEWEDRLSQILPGGQMRLTRGNPTADNIRVEIGWLDQRWESDTGEIDGLDFDDPPDDAIVMTFQTRI